MTIIIQLNRLVFIFAKVVELALLFQVIRIHIKEGFIFNCSSHLLVIV